MFNTVSSANVKKPFSDDASKVVDRYISILSQQERAELYDVYKFDFQMFDYPMDFKEI